MLSSHGVMQQGSSGGSSMSTSLLYHAFGLVGYRYVRQEFREGQVIFHIEQPRERLRCSQCGSADLWAQGSVDRTFRLPPIGRKPVLLRFVGWPLGSAPCRTRTYNPLIKSQLLCQLS